MLTYHSFVTSNQLLTALIKRYPFFILNYLININIIIIIKIDKKKKRKEKKKKKDFQIY